MDRCMLLVVVLVLGVTQVDGTAGPPGGDAGLLSPVPQETRQAGQPHLVDGVLLETGTRGWQPLPALKW